MNLSDVFIEADFAVRTFSLDDALVFADAVRRLHGDLIAEYVNVREDERVKAREAIEMCWALLDTGWIADRVEVTP